jgi:hypothetical protein
MTGSASRLEPWATHSTLANNKKAAPVAQLISSDLSLKKGDRPGAMS